MRYEQLVNASKPRSFPDCMLKELALKAFMPKELDEWAYAARALLENHALTFSMV